MILSFVLNGQPMHIDVLPDTRVIDLLARIARPYGHEGGLRLRRVRGLHASSSTERRASPAS